MNSYLPFLFSYPRLCCLHVHQYLIFSLVEMSNFVLIIIESFHFYCITFKATEI